MQLELTNKHIGLYLLMKDCGIDSSRACPIAIALEEKFGEHFVSGMDCVWSSSHKFAFTSSCRHIVYRLMWNKPIKAQIIELEEINDNS